MLVNQRSHAHGQGWTDVNFLIPELAATLEYHKGPYSAADGDFAAAGSVSVQYADTLPNTLVSLGIGENGYRRGLIAGSPKVADGNLLYALELFHNDGPFTKGDHYRKINGVLRYSRGTKAAGFSVTGMAYNAIYNATDQIPQRAVDNGSLPRFSSIDPTDGGEVHRYSLSAEWHRATANTATKISGYVIDNRLRIFSNFTYFLDDPVNGDQFAQPDDRTSAALNASHSWRGSLLGHPSESTVGLQIQRDAIRNGLLNTKARQELSETRRDRIKETSIGGYFENTTRWSDKFRTVLGVREDYYDFDVQSGLPVNSGKAHAALFSSTRAVHLGPKRAFDQKRRLSVRLFASTPASQVASVVPQSRMRDQSVTDGPRAPNIDIRCSSPPIRSSSHDLFPHRPCRRRFGDTCCTDAGRAGAQV